MFGRKKQHIELKKISDPMMVHFQDEHVIKIENVGYAVNRDRKCTACKGEIVQPVTQRLDNKGEFVEWIARSVSKIEPAYICSKCGILYYFLPPKPVLTKKESKKV
ncbi:MAG: hypothetical protein HYS87_03120 [Candidatus Colwellbacteria bacterium]|nr:hypothetical protein [Candidatus Colwellbacteria bacterium]